MHVRGWMHSVRLRAYSTATGTDVERAVADGLCLAQYTSGSVEVCRRDSLGTRGAVGSRLNFLPRLDDWRLQYFRTTQARISWLHVRLTFQFLLPTSYWF
jgi:hypothetical protein